MRMLREVLLNNWCHARQIDPLGKRTSLDLGTSDCTMAQLVPTPDVTRSQFRFVIHGKPRAASEASADLVSTVTALFQRMSSGYFSVDSKIVALSSDVLHLVVAVIRIELLLSQRSPSSSTDFQRCGLDKDRASQT